MKETLKKTGIPFKKLINSPLSFQLISLSILFIFVFSFRPNHFTRKAEFFGDVSSLELNKTFPITEDGFLNSYYGVSTAGSREIIITDEEGNEVVKIQPKKRSKTLIYKVKSGENISKIAHKFGLNVSTINWANNITSKSTIQVGQELKIPPTNGIYYEVESGDTLSEIAKIHGVDIKKIYSFNLLNEGGKLSTGQEIFIPEAKKVYVIRNLEVPTSSGQKTGTTPYQIPKVSTTSGGTIASMGTKLQKPTQGILTQGYHKGHYAIDIANKMNTPIYAAAGGKVIKESHSGWNYGYGRYIVIDHGNGVETLYAHNNVTKVGVGDIVKRGQLISLMGNTGRVFGVTGIHLHFELRINGRKVNPTNYF